MGYERSQNIAAPIRRYIQFMTGHHMLENIMQKGQTVSAQGFLLLYNTSASRNALHCCLMEDDLVQEKELKLAILAVENGGP